MDWSAGQFWASTMLVIVAFSGLYFNYLLVSRQYDPHVIVYSKNDESRPSIILLIIENIGRGVAKDVVFKNSRPIPHQAHGVTADKAKEPLAYDIGPLSTGIPALGPGAKRVMIWGQYGGLEKALGNGVISVTASYRSDGFGTFGPKDHVTVSLVDVASYAHTDAVDPDGARKSAKQLKRIADLLQKRQEGATGRDG